MLYLVAFHVKDIEGKEWSNAKVAGRPMVLNFWYTGCGPCIREMPELNKWMDLYPDATYLATTFDSATQIKKIVENRPFRFTQIADELAFFQLFNVSGMPVTILTDMKGLHLLPLYIQHGADDPPVHRGDAPQPLQPRAPEQVQYHRLGVVVGGVGGGDFPGQAAQKRVSGQIGRAHV